jgi:hypothetical protein
MIRVTVEDTDTGDRGQTTIPDNSYFVVTTGTCKLEHENLYATGTVVLTLKGVANPMGGSRDVTEEAAG